MNPEIAAKAHEEDDFGAKQRLQQSFRWMMRFFTFIPIPLITQTDAQTMFEVTTQDKKIIAQMARDSLNAAVSGKQIPSPSEYPALSFTQHDGAFVTLYNGEALRGCIGLLDNSVTFSETLIEATQKSATEDYRFDPIRSSELPALKIDVTILTPRERISPDADIVIGTHGLIIELRGKRGLLLPQVASERNWNAHQFLNALCKKAYLPSESWRDPAAKLYRFCGYIFSFPYQDNPGGGEI